MELNSQKKQRGFIKRFCTGIGKGCLVFLTVCLFLCGCGKHDGADIKGQYLLFSDKQGLSLSPVEWEPSEPEGTVRAKVEEALQSMKEPKKEEDVVSVFPADLTVQIKSLKEGKLDFAFGREYRNLSKKDELLLRAAVVQSLVQIEGVSQVRFLVDGVSLTEEDGTEIGYMRADDFVQNIGSALDSYEKTSLTLYFADAREQKLKTEKVDVRYNRNTSVQKLIVEQLLKGPRSDDCRGTLPPDTLLLGVSLRDGICYVNFDEGFLAQGYTVDPALVIYSIVNSLTEEDEVQMVQISVNGESDVKFQNVVDLSKPFVRNMDMVEETQQD